MLAIKIGNVRYNLSHISFVVERQSDMIYRSDDDMRWIESVGFKPKGKELQSGLVVQVYYDFALEEGQAYDTIYMSDAEKFLELYDYYMNTMED
jgi:hypothetical protein